MAMVAGALSLNLLVTFSFSLSYVLYFHTHTHKHTINVSPFCCLIGCVMDAGLQRCGKSCRLRWINYLRPDLKRGSFSPEEAALIVELHSILGNRYISLLFPSSSRT
jgi:hypothetical protein